MTSDFLCLALVVLYPVSLFVIMSKFQAMHKQSLETFKATQIVNGQPAHILEKRAEIVNQQLKEEAERRSYLNETVKRRLENTLG